MLQGFLVLLVLTAIAYGLIPVFKRRYPLADRRILSNLVWFHWALSIAYFVYVMANRSDSRMYFFRVDNFSKGETWFSFYGTSTTFIDWLAYPFIHFLGYTYEACMAQFAFFGLLGFFYFHIFFQERFRLAPQFLGYSLPTIFLFLPNMHFWSGSLGKGSVIFLGIALIFFALNRPQQRWIHLLIGGLIVYHVRPHIMLVILVSTAIGAVFTTRGVSGFLRFAILAGAIVALTFIYTDVLNLVGIEQEEFLDEGVDLSHRASELTKAGSGIDIQNYNMAQKLFAFLYRPLFIDVPSAFGFFVSIENLFYLILTIQFFARGGLMFLIRGDFITKTAFLSFITVSIALAQISGNLGLAIRQKSQVMMLFMFVIAYYFQYLEIQKRKQTRARKQVNPRMARRARVL